MIYYVYQMTNLLQWLVNNEHIILIYQRSVIKFQQYLFYFL